MEESIFEPGDVVQLKSGDRPMTVAEVRAPRPEKEFWKVRCYWLNCHDDDRNADFPYLALKKYPAEKQPAKINEFSATIGSPLKTYCQAFGDDFVGCRKCRKPFIRVEGTPFFRRECECNIIPFGSSEPDTKTLIGLIQHLKDAGVSPEVAADIAERYLRK